MDKKRFTIQSTATELELYDDNNKIGEFPHSEWVAESVTSVVDLLNEQQATINLLLELLYLSEELRQERDYWRDKFKDGRKENKQLKKTIGDLQEVISEICAILISQSGIESEFIYYE